MTSLKNNILYTVIQI